MSKYIIRGGKSLAGDVVINGAKNAALGIVAAAIMSDEMVTIENLPDVWDINVLLDAIRDMGAIVDRVDRHTVKIVGSMCSFVVDNENMRKMRGSYYLLGALLGKYKRAQVPLPGGCNIGSRPVEQHIKGFRQLGAKVEVTYGGVLSAEATTLKGSHIFFDIVSVGATINVMLAAALTPGQTILENVAKEPHIVDVANFLNNGMEQYFVFENAFNKDKIQVLDLYVYHLAMGNGGYSVSVAISMLKSFISVTLLLVLNRISKSVRGESIL